MSSMASFFIKKYLKITYARALHCTKPFSASFPPYPKEKGKTPGWKRGNNSMAMQPPPLMSCPETTSCFSEMIIASTTLKGSINQSEVKLFLEYCSLILTYVNIVLCNIMSNMGKHSFTFGQRPTKCKRRMKQWYAVKLYVTLSCRSAFIIFFSHGGTLLYYNFRLRMLSWLYKNQTSKRLKQTPQWAGDQFTLANGHMINLLTYKEFWKKLFCAVGGK